MRMTSYHDTRPETMAWLRAYIAEHGIAPTQTELAAGLGISQRAVHKRLHRLSRCAWIRLLSRQHRGIVIVNSDNFDVAA